MTIKKYGLYKEHLTMPEPAKLLGEFDSKEEAERELFKVEPHGNYYFYVDTIII